VVNSGGAGVAGVTVTTTGGITASTKVTTNAQGYYGFSNLASISGGTIYVLTPSLTGKSFTPTSLAETVSPTVDATGANFTES
jgi:hypothetical protein